MVLVALGALLVCAAIFAGVPAAVGSILVLCGTGTLVLGVLLPRVEGPVELGPGGLKLAIQAVVRRSEELNLGPEQQVRAVKEIVSRVDILRSVPGVERRSSGLRRALPGRALGAEDSRAADRFVQDLAEQVIDDVEDEAGMDDIDPLLLHPDALTAIQEAAGLHDPPQATSARQRPGRGAPRWHVTTRDAGRWRVTNTRWGWSARRLG